MSKQKYSDDLIIVGNLEVDGSFQAASVSASTDIAITGDLSSASVTTTDVELSTLNFASEKSKEIDIPLSTIIAERNFLYEKSSTSYDLWQYVEYEDGADLSYISNSFHGLVLSTLNTGLWNFGFYANPYIVNGCTLKYVKITLQASSAVSGTIRVSSFRFEKNNSGELWLGTIHGQADTIAQSTRQELIIPINTIFDNSYYRKFVIENTSGHREFAIYSISFVFSSTDVSKLIGIV